MAEQDGNRPALKTLTLRNLFGINANVRNNIHYLDDNSIMYIAGNTLVFVDEERRQTFHTEEQCSGITSLAYTSQSNIAKTAIFIGEKTREEGPQITIYGRDERGNIKKKRPLQIPDLNCNEFISISVSQDAKYIVAQAGAPEYKLCCFVIDAKGPNFSKVGSVIPVSTPEKDPIYQCAINPSGSHVAVVGNGIFKLFSNTEGELTMIHSSIGNRKEVEGYFSACWLDDTRLVVGNEHGDLFFIENAELKGLLPCSPSDGLAIHSIVPFGKGFIAGGEDSVIHIFEQVDDPKEIFKKSKSFKVDPSVTKTETSIEGNDKEKVMSMSLSLSGDQLVLSTSKDQIYTLNLSNSDILKEEEMRFENLLIPFHAGKILGVSACIRKPLIATCATDKTIRLWNFMDTSRYFVKQFNVEVLSVSLHPSGLFLVAGFLDKLRFLNILGTDIMEVKAFNVRNCNEVKFSHGGNMFAAVQGNIINIYSTYTLQQVYNLRGHNGKIRNLQWSDDDSRIVSAGMDGATMEFEVKTQRKLFEYNAKSGPYTGVAFGNNDQTIYTASTDRMLREIDNYRLKTECGTGDYAIQSVVFSNNNGIVMGGLEDGTVRVYNELLEIDEQLAIHSEPISKMCLAYDESMLVTVSEDGSIALFDVKEKEAGKQLLKKEMIFAEEILISANDLEDRENTISDLKAKIAEMKSDFEYEQRKKELEFNEKLKEQASNFKLELKKKIEANLALKNQLSSLKETQDQQLLHTKDGYKLEVEKMEHDFNQRLAAAMEQINQMKQERQEEKSKLLAQLQKTSDSHQLETQEMVDKYEEKIRELKENRDELKEQKSILQKKFDETKKQLEEDREREVFDLKADYESQINTTVTESVALRGRMKMYEEEKKVLDEVLEQKQKDIEKYQESLAEARNLEKSLRKEIASLKRENKEREDTIIEKEKRIFELKKQNQELDKFKFVLDYKITSLQDQIKPSKDTIVELQQALKQKEQHLTKSEETIVKLKLLVKELEQKYDAAAKETVKTAHKYKEGQLFINRFQGELFEAIQLIQEPKSFKDAVKKLYHTYATNFVKPVEADYDIQRENDRQRSYLEKTVEGLKMKLSKASETAKSDTKKVMQENIALISEINELRKEVRILKSKLKEKEYDDKNNQSRMNAEEIRDTESTFSFHPGELTIEEAKREIELQKLEIQTLRAKLEELEEQHNHVMSRLSSHGSSRPISREKLPPMESFPEDE